MDTKIEQFDREVKDALASFEVAAKELKGLLEDPNKRKERGAKLLRVVEEYGFVMGSMQTLLTMQGQFRKLFKSNDISVN